MSNGKPKVSAIPNAEPAELPLGAAAQAEPDFIRRLLMTPGVLKATELYERGVQGLGGLTEEGTRPILDRQEEIARQLFEQALQSGQIQEPVQTDTGLPQELAKPPSLQDAARRNQAVRDSILKSLGGT